MIINKTTKSIEHQSHRPNENWMGDGWFLVPDGTELADKILACAPNFDIIVKGGKLLDVMPTEPLEPEPEPLEPPALDYVTFADLAEMLGLAAEPDSRKAIAETLSDVALVSRERKVELELEPGIIDKPIKGLST